MIVLYNPLSTTPGKQPLPLSVLSLAAVLEGRERWTIVDGNLEPDPAAAIIHELTAVPRRDPALLAVTVMPGPQLTQAIAVCRRVRQTLPHVPIVWGGYFPTEHTGTVLASSFVDLVVRSQGEGPLLQLAGVLKSGGSLAGIGSLSWQAGGKAVHNPAQKPADLDDLPELPYHRLDMNQYIHPNYLGRRTVAHNSSFGCPFACSFCAVVAMSNRRWLAQTPARLERVLRHLTAVHGVDAVQMHDMDFFVSEARTAEFSKRITPLGIGWWGLGRVDTLMQYSDETWRRMAQSGLRMVFCGAESGSDEALAAMNKGGKSAARLALDLARRMREFAVVPEYSFVVGAPPQASGSRADVVDALTADLERTFEFVRAIKVVNPATEIVLYTYTPVPMEGGLFSEASRLGFSFPASLDEWAGPEWQRLMMRRGDGIPWIDGRLRQRIRDFERVLNAYYPTVTDRRLTRARRALLRTVSAWRYGLKIYTAPYELRALHRLMQYQRPETTGF